MKKHKLKVNWSMSNTMVFSRVPTECNIEIDGEKVKNVKETVYLGVKLGEDGKMGGEVRRKKNRNDNADSGGNEEGV